MQHLMLAILEIGMATRTIVYMSGWEHGKIESVFGRLGDKKKKQSKGNKFGQRDA
jgi:hypothetical protein